MEIDVEFIKIGVVAIISMFVAKFGFEYEKSKKVQNNKITISIKR